MNTLTLDKVLDLSRNVNKYKYKYITNITTIDSKQEYQYPQKAIGLFEQGVFITDKYVVESIYYYWYKDSTLPRFPIIETNGTVADYLFYLNKYYAEGYRYFLGFSRSTIVSGVLSWFLSHPDAVGFSLTSGAISLAVPKNIYRLITPLNSSIPTLEMVSSDSVNVYYIYNTTETISVDFLNLLTSNPQIGPKLLTYPINTNADYNVTAVSTFLSGASPTDVIFLGIFQPDLYLNLYNVTVPPDPPGVTFNGKAQYAVVGAVITIQDFIDNTSGASAKFDNKYFILDNVYSNTSYLWRENHDFLVEKYGNDASSGSLLNALKMIQSFLLNNNVDYLASHSGTLQFDANNDLEYYSYLILVYKQATQSYEKSYLSFSDPLLGNFEANFI